MIALPLSHQPGSRRLIACPVNLISSDSRAGAPLPYRGGDERVALPACERAGRPPFRGRAGASLVSRARHQLPSPAVRVCVSVVLSLQSEVR